jgi:replication-associated recombination protein RarA
MPGRLELWNEELRPRNIEECVLPDRIKQPLLHMERTGNYQHLLLVGGAGRGKSTCAKVLCSHPDVIYRATDMCVGPAKTVKDALEIFVHFMVGGTLFDEILGTSSRGRRRLILLDEAQTIRLQDQELLKQWIEHPANSATFILAMNEEKVLLPALRSRLVRLDFEPTIAEYPDLVRQACLRCEELARRKKIHVTPKDIEAVVKNSFPDLRQMVGQLYLMSLTRTEHKEWKV